MRIALSNSGLPNATYNFSLQQHNVFMLDGRYTRKKRSNTKQTGNLCAWGPYERVEQCATKQTLRKYSPFTKLL